MSNFSDLVSEVAPPARTPHDAAARLKKERTWTEDAAASVLEGDHYIEWLKLRSTHRFMAFQNKKLLLWRLFLDQPKLEQIVTISNISLGWDGMAVDVKVGSGKDNVVTVSHDPVRIADAVYLWLPYYNDLQALAGESDFLTLRFSMMARQAFNPHRDLKEGPLYISEPAAFRELWPDTEQDIQKAR